MATENCKNIKNPLRLKGIAQEDRLPIALDPNLLKIDGKTEADYKRIVQELAKITQYYNADNLRDGDWLDFFSTENLKTNKPHIALFNAFVKLIKHAQDDINDISAKHLEFYYNEVLQIAKKSETSDEAHILFSLANNIDNHLIEAGTVLKADKDETGKRRFYKTKEDIVVNRTEIAELKSVFVQDKDDIITVFSANSANSADGKGEELDPENPKWAPFGQEQKADIPKSMDLAPLGFAIASDFLLLKEGERIITLTINFTNGHEIDDLIPSDFTIYLSGEKEWITLEPTDVLYTNTKALQIGFTIATDSASIIGYNETLYGENFNTNKPVLKLMINQDETRNTYGQLSGLETKNITIKAQVTGVKDIVFQNETGVLDPAKPFEPFGYSPVIASEFLIGSKEVFSKKLENLDFVIDWMDLPDLSSHYSHYKSSGSDKSLTENDFTVKITALKERSFENNFLHNHGLSAVLFRNEINLSGTELEEVFFKTEEVLDFKEYKNSTKNGFVKLEITGPNENYIKALGHGQYQNVYVTQAIALSKGSSTDPLPNKPYTPKIKSLAVNYIANHTIILNSDTTEDTSNGQFFHLGPFGSREKTPSATDKMDFIPLFANQGTFYIGLKNAVVPQNISLLFQVSEGSANPNKLPETIQWSYLIDNDWENFGDTSLISDESKGIIQSGIVKIELPKNFNNTNTWLSKNNYWIKATIPNESDSVCQLVDLKIQAVTAIFENNDNDLAHLAESLPAETISKLNINQSVIREVIQPYASFNGKLPETGNDYYRRVSERLRHKNRAITIWDYERMVLEEFPSVYKVKCLNHTRMNINYSEQAPGNVSLIVISNLRNKNAVNPLQPNTSISTLNAISEFLEDVKDPFVDLHVKNPDFEEVKVAFNVRLYSGKDKGLYEKQLNEDLKIFLSPWAYSEGKDISFEGIIHKSKIINFVEERDYVDYVSCFKMYHIINGDVSDLKDINEAKPSKASAILVSTTEHDIHVLETDDCDCDDDNITAEVIIDGIAAMTVAVDLIVKKP